MQQPWRGVGANCLLNTKISAVVSVRGLVVNVVLCRGQLPSCCRASLSFKQQGSVYMLDSPNGVRERIWAVQRRPARYIYES